MSNPNPFSLFSDMPESREATKELMAEISIFVKSMDNITKKHRNVGARDTASREAIVYYVEKVLCQTLWSMVPLVHAGWNSPHDAIISIFIEHAYSKYLRIAPADVHLFDVVFGLNLFKTSQYFIAGCKYRISDVSVPSDTEIITLAYKIYAHPNDHFLTYAEFEVWIDRLGSDELKQRLIAYYLSLLECQKQSILPTYSLE